MRVSRLLCNFYGINRGLWQKILNHKQAFDIIQIQTMKKIMFIKNQKGGAIVEFAIVLPLLVLIIGGVIELGLLFYAV